MAWVLKKIYGYKFLFDFRGMLAEEYVDGGHWHEGELKYRLTKGMERAFFREADAFVMLTDRIKRDLTRDEPMLAERADDITVIPCCVDTARFNVDQEAREAYRQMRDWTGRLVLTYVGKLGLWYLPDEMARFFAAAVTKDSRFFFQVLTQSDASSIRAALAKYGVRGKDYDIRFAAPSELPKILAASDAGISLIQACNSKRASSPTKIGEYLAAGLPVVVNAGVGDGDRMMKDHRVGVVLREFSAEAHRQAADELLVLLESSETASTCRVCAWRVLSLDEVGGPRYGEVYSRLFDALPETSSGRPMEAA
jgi:glycosyltransferase involved in cell wall biosynthesis